MLHYALVFFVIALIIQAILSAARNA